MPHSIQSLNTRMTSPPVTVLGIENSPTRPGQHSPLLNPGFYKKRTTTLHIRDTTTILPPYFSLVSNLICHFTNMNQEVRNEDPALDNETLLLTCYKS